jgi:predicted Zn-dependent protease
MRSEWPGFYFDGSTSQRIPATIIPTPHGLQIRIQGGTVVWPYRTIRQTLGSYSGEPVRFEKGVDPTETVVVADDDCLDRIRRYAFSHSIKFHNPKSRRMRPLRIASAAVVTGAIVAAAYLWGIPAAARSAASRVPVGWERQLGGMTADRFSEGMAICEDGGVNTVIGGVLDRLESAAGPQPYPFTVTVVRFPHANAMAFPGGRIFIFSGLLERTRRPEELAAVLAHEVVHVVKRHGLQLLFQQVALKTLAASVMGDYSGSASVLAEGGKTLGRTAYSRDHEREADRVGMELLNSAGIDPSAMPEFFDVLRDGNGDIPDSLKFFSTHPHLSNRIDDLRRRSEDYKGPYAPLFPHLDWGTLRNACSDTKNTPGGLPVKKTIQ